MPHSLNKQRPKTSKSTDWTNLTRLADRMNELDIPDPAASDLRDLVLELVMFVRNHAK